MDAARPTLVMLAACLLAAAAVLPLAAAQEPQPDKNGIVQAEGFQSSLTAQEIVGNPLGLFPAVAQQEGMDLPNGGLTFSSQVNAEISADALNLWTFEFDGYNVENVGLTTLHNLKDPRWPEVFKLFDSVSSPDFAPIVSQDITRQDMDKLAQSLTDANGKNLGYKTMMQAVNDTAVGVVARMGNDPTQAIFGVLGNDIGASDLKGGIDQPVNDDTFIPLTDEELAALPDPASLKPEGEGYTKPAPTPETTAVTAAPAPEADASAVAAPSPGPSTSALPPTEAETAAPPATAPPALPTSAAGILRAGMVMAAAMMAGLALLA